MDIQWYPGHMTKAKRDMRDNIKLIDLVIELVDARAPLSTRNPDIDEIAAGKARIILMNKFDMADPVATESWSEYFKSLGFYVNRVNSRNGEGVKSTQALIREACREKTERDRKRGILNRPVRAMVVGVPNVGKSTFINTLAGKACAKTGNKPGVTKGKQWIRLNKSVELLDTPGILWPKFEEPMVGARLAWIGSIRDEVLNAEELALELILFLRKNYKDTLGGKYQISEEGEPYEVLERIADRRKCLLPGGKLDTAKASAIFLDDFRNGKIGRITLEYPSHI